MALTNAQKTAATNHMKVAHTDMLGEEEGMSQANNFLASLTSAGKKDAWLQTYHDAYLA